MMERANFMENLFQTYNPDFPAAAAALEILSAFDIFRSHRIVRPTKPPRLLPFMAYLGSVHCERGVSSAGQGSRLNGRG